MNEIETGIFIQIKPCMDFRKTCNNQVFIKETIIEMSWQEYVGRKFTYFLREIGSHISQIYQHGTQYQDQEYFAQKINYVSING